MFGNLILMIKQICVIKYILNGYINNQYTFSNKLWRNKVKKILQFTRLYHFSTKNLTNNSILLQIDCMINYNPKNIRGIQRPKYWKKLNNKFYRKNLFYHVLDAIDILIFLLRYYFLHIFRYLIIQNIRQYISQFSTDIYIIKLTKQNMKQAINDDITPWQQDRHFNISTIQYQDKKKTNHKKKTPLIQYNIQTISSKRRNSKKQKYLQNQRVSMKNYITHSLSSKSQEEFMKNRIEKIITKIKQEENIKTIGIKSTIISPFKFDMERQINDKFVIKKHQRIRNFSKAFFKQAKIEDIFRKIYDIQNPNQRKNISLPKIQLKI